MLRCEGNKRGKGRHWKFTLIELLMVISIIALLISMLLPALSRAKAKGKQAKCNNRLKQLAIAFNYYVTDRDGFMVHDLDDATLPGEYWHQKLREAVGEIDRTETYTTPVQFVSDPGMSGAFAYTTNDSAHYLYNSQVNGMRLVQADDTEKTVLLFDGSDSVRLGGDADTTLPADLLNDVTLTFPHPADRANILSLDGHVYVINANSAISDVDDIFWRPRPPEAVPTP